MSKSIESSIFFIFITPKMGLGEGARIIRNQNVLPLDRASSFHKNAILNFLELHLKNSEFIHGFLDF
jgi:hypothetical protein